MLLFGGSDVNYDELGQPFGQLFSDLWSYQVASNTWVQLAPSGTPPSARSQHTAVWDPAGNQMLVFGGSDGSGSGLNDLWSYTAGSDSWAPLRPSGTTAAARADHTAVWDAVANRMLVFGGFGSDSSSVNDLLSYQAASNNWAPFGASGAQPPARSWRPVVWDPAESRLFIFGGCCSYNDLWSYRASSNSWMQLTPSGTPPPARYGDTGCLGRDPGPHAAGDNPARVRSEGAFAHLCGVVPMPAGKPYRHHRLN